jgi:hypothetical protein
MRRQGAAVQFRYWNVSKTVVIQKFTWEFERFYECPYKIELLVVQDNIAAQGASQPTADDAVSSDVSLAQKTSAGGSPALKDAASNVSTTYGATGPLAGQTEGDLAPLSNATSTLSSASAVDAAGDQTAVSSVASIQPGGDLGAMSTAAATAPDHMAGAASGVTTGAVADRLQYNYSGTGAYVAPPYDYTAGMLVP